MAITYDWVIEQMNCYPQLDGQTDVVFNVSWRLNGTDGTYSATIYGTIDIQPYTSGEPFTPYADLTQSQVVGWVQAAMGEKQVSEYETNIEDQIVNQTNPPVVSPPLPWQS